MVRNLEGSHDGGAVAECLHLTHKQEAERVREVGRERGKTKGVSHHCPADAMSVQVWWRQKRLLDPLELRHTWLRSGN